MAQISSHQAYGLAALALPIVSGVAAGVDSEASFDLLELTTIFSLFIFLALVIERVCEVAMLALTRLAVLPPDPRKDPDAPDSPIRSGVGMALCLVLSTIIALQGYHFLEHTLKTFPVNLPKSQKFTSIDVVVTSLLLVGGADGIHQILKAFSKSLDEGAKP